MNFNKKPINMFYYFANNSLSWFELVPFLLFLFFVVNAPMFYTTPELRFKRINLFAHESVGQGQAVTVRMALLGSTVSGSLAGKTSMIASLLTILWPGLMD